MQLGICLICVQQREVGQKTSVRASQFCVRIEGAIGAGEERLLVEIRTILFFKVSEQESHLLLGAF